MPPMSLTDRVFFICDAYEAGFGKGLQAHQGHTIINPYEPGTENYLAWGFGYAAGVERAKEITRQISADAIDAARWRAFLATGRVTAIIPV